MSHTLNRFKALDTIRMLVRDDPIMTECDCSSSSQRDTLFVSTSDAKSEVIVSYNSGRLQDSDKGQTSNRFVPNSSSVESATILDMDDLDDPFGLCKFLLSWLLSGGPNRCFRTCLSLSNKAGISHLITGLCLAGNVAPLSTILIKKNQISPEITVFAQRTNVTKFPPPEQSTTLDPRRYSEVSDFAVELFGLLYVKNCSAEVVLTDDVEPLVKAVSVICSEAVDDFPLLVVKLEPEDSASSIGGTRAVIATASAETSKEIQSKLRIPRDTKNGKIFAAGLPPGSIIQLNFLDGAIDVTRATADVLRILLAGYCSVELRFESLTLPAATTSAIWEMFLVIVKYIEFSFKVEKGFSLIITRKSVTIDPLVPSKSEKNEINEFEETASLMAIASHILTYLSKESKAKVSLPKSVQLTTALSSILVQACEGCIVTLSQNGSDMRKVNMLLKAEGDVGDVSCILSQLSDPSSASSPGDVSPSNYKPVDATIRHGTDDETKQFREKLRALIPDDLKRFSVLLVGPWNIGTGVRVIAEESQTDNSFPQFEFISERAVRDGQGVNLKCAARIFVRKEQSIAQPIGWFKKLLGNTAIVEVAESDSRITIANRLFTFLNEAPSSNPYVLIRAKGDYCTFIAAMSVIVANGWSRTIQQRVETRVFQEPTEETVYYITRLIINTP